jgi:hypothetical protein
MPRQIVQSAKKHVTLSSAVKVKLPQWNEAMRCLPNEIAHSALFNAKNRRQARAYLERSKIAVIGDGRITFTGRELRQDDETVWLQLLHLAKERPLGTLVEFTPYSLCKAIGWTKLQTIAPVFRPHASNGTVNLFKTPTERN